MLYYASSRAEGAWGLADRYNLEYVPPKDYIKENNIYFLIEDLSRDILFGAIQDHERIHAFALPSLKLYFYPSTLIAVIAAAYEDHFRKVLSRMGDA